MAPCGLLGTAVVAVVVSLALQVMLNCPIQPLPSPPLPSVQYPPNNLLQGLEKLGEGLLSRPDDVHVDVTAGGTLYTATVDGWLQRTQPNGSWEHWRFVGGTGLVGFTPSVDGSTIVCDADRMELIGTKPTMLTCKGLLRVEEGRITILASTVEESTIRFTNAAIEASDGTIYFSDSSARFPFEQWILDFMEFSSTGRLLMYDPATRKASVLLNNLAFANGVAVSRDETFVIVCQSWRYLCSKLWLNGDKIGQAEPFVNNLPGCPDNIRLAPDGSFWIALVQLRSTSLDFVTRWTLTKRVVASFPMLLSRIKATAKGAKVVQVSEDGQIIRVLDDSEGKVISFVSSVTEFNGDLFLGSLSTNFVGKLSLTKLPQVQAAVSSHTLTIVVLSSISFRTFYYCITMCKYVFNKGTT